MAHYLYVDIETLPADNRASVPEPKAPANYKDPEKIQAYIEEHRESAYRATSLDPLLGRVFCIGYAFDDEEANVVVNATGDNEQAMFQRFEEVVQAYEVRAHGPLVWVGHNIEGFDLAWLYFRACRYACFHLARSIPWMPYQRAYRIDTMLLAGGPSRNRVSLARLAEFFHLGGKLEGIDGSQVYDLFLSGSKELIWSYCIDDVKLTRKLHYVLDLHSIHERENA
jgi:predicted PolB exonuclease-like 3'-5' exonuclease